jgi:hypothetical protein
VASKSLSFLLFGEDVTASKAFRKVAAEAERSDASIKGSFGKGSLLAVGGLVAGLGLAAKGAADFQTQMMRLVTAAGESQSNLKLVSKGVMDISSATGTSLKATGDAMYYVESAGFHGTKGLTVLKAAMQGAKVEGADSKVVADALTTALTDLGSKAGPPAKVMSQLVDTVAHGKMTMDDLAGSLHSVLPNAAAIGISFSQVTGALATMTAQGISADQAAQNLNHAILSLANPTSVQTAAMAALGLNSSMVAKNLGKVGLTGTLEELSNAITSHMGPAGLTISNALNQSQIAAGKATEAYKALSPELRKYADEVVKGGHATVTARQLGQGFDLAQKTQIQQWERLYKGAHGFSDLLKAKSPDALTYAAAMAKITGGQTGLQVALHLTGENMVTFKGNVDDISKSTADAGGNVKDFALKQQTLNQKLSELRTSASNLGVELGTQMIPALTSAADWTLKHKGAVELLVGSLVTLKLGIMAVNVAQAAWAAGTALVGAAVSGLETLYVGAMIAMDSAMGPIGLAIAGITVAIGFATHGFGLFGKSASDQVKPVQALTDAILADGDAFGKLTQAQVVNTLQSKGLFDAGLKLGIGQGTLTAAAMGNANAMRLVNDILKTTTSSIVLNRQQIQVWDPLAKKWTTRWVEANQAQKDALAAANKLTGGLGLQKQQLDASFHAANNVAIAQGKAKAASEAHAAAAVANSNKLQLESLAAQTVATKFHNVHDAMDKIPPLKQTKVQVAAEIALARLQSVHDAVDSIPRYITLNIGVNNNVGKAVHDAVNSIPGQKKISAGGRSYWPGGRTSMNEAGGEIVDLPQGSRVYPHGQTPPPLGGGTVTVNVYAGIGTNGTQVGKQIAAELEKHVGNGGQVKIAQGIK